MFRAEMLNDVSVMNRPHDRRDHPLPFMIDLVRKTHGMHAPARSAITRAKPVSFVEDEDT